MTSTVSQPSAASSDESAVPKKHDANCFVISVSLGCMPRRASICTSCEPATSVRSDGILAMKTAAAWLFAPSKATVVKMIGTPLARQASISRRVARDDRVEVGAERRGGVGEAVDEVDHEQGGPPAEAGGPAEPALAVERRVVHQSPAAAAAASASRTRLSATSPGSSGDQRSGVAGFGGSRPVSARQFASVSSSDGPKSNACASPRSLALAGALGLGRGLVDAAVGGEHDAVVRLRALDRDEPERRRRARRVSAGRSKRSFQPPPPAVR